MFHGDGSFVWQKGNGRKLYNCGVSQTYALGLVALLLTPDGLKCLGQELSQQMSHQGPRLLQLALQRFRTREYSRGPRSAKRLLEAEQNVSPSPFVDDAGVVKTSFRALPPLEQSVSIVFPCCLFNACIVRKEVID